MRLVLDLSDPSIQNAPTAIRNAWGQAATILDNAITDNITFNLKVTWGVDNGSTGGASAYASGGADIYTNSTITNLLQTKASDGDSTFASLPPGDTLQGFTGIDVWRGQQKALGLLDPNDPGEDGHADFGTGVASNLMVGVALHEFTHAMGRIPYHKPDIFDLFRFSGNTRLISDTTPADPAIFSLTGGLTEWAAYGINSDPSDLLNTDPNETNDAFNEFYGGNTLQYLTPLDLEQMDALGYHLKFNAPAIDSHDFNGDNFGDVLVQNPTTGDIAYYSAPVGTPGTWTGIGRTPGWNVVGEGKISGGTSSDVVVEDASGHVWYANMGSSGQFSNWVQWDSVAITGFQVMAVADIDCDHKCDLVVENNSTGQIYWGRTSNSGVTSGALDQWFNVGTALGWKVVGAGDINNDGCADVVIQNATTGDIDYANMIGGQFAGWTYVATVPGFDVVGVGDIDRNGCADLVIQNRTTGQIEWGNFNHNTSFGSWKTVLDPVSGWKVIAVEDMLGTGYKDIVIQSASDGSICYADMTLGQVNGSWIPMTATPGWTGTTSPGGVSSVGPVSMNDPGAQGGSIAAVAMSDPAANTAVSAVTAHDPGVQNGTAIGPVSMFDPGPNGSALGPITMSDPGLLGNAIGAMVMSDPGPQNSGQHLYSM